MKHRMIFWFCLLIAYAEISPLSTGMCSVSPWTSRLILSGSRSIADGHARVSITAELRNENGLPLTGEQVLLQSDNTSFIFLQPAATDSNGVSTGTLTSYSPGTGALWALVSGIKIYPNLIQNSSAKIGVSSPSFWSQFANDDIAPPDQEFLWSRDGASNASPALGMKVSGHSPATYELSWLQKVNSADLFPGATYSLSALVRASTDYYPAGPQSGAGLSAANMSLSGLTQTSSRTLLSNLSSDWNSIRISSMIFPQNVDQVEVSLSFMRSTGSVWFDGVQMWLWPSVEFKENTVPPIPNAQESSSATISFLTVDQARDSRFLGTKAVFSGRTQALTGVNIAIDGLPEGKTSSDPDGRWSYRVQNPLTEGSHLGFFQAFDGSGNKSPAIEFPFQVGSDAPSDQIEEIVPNPVRLALNRGCIISVAIAEHTNAVIKIFDINGREVSEVANGDFDVGRHSFRWDGRDKNGNLLSSDTYLALLKTGSVRQVRAFTVLK